MALPQIYIQESNSTDRYRTSSRSSSYKSTSSPATSAMPMSIPNSREPVPPPLPPPKHIAEFSDRANGGRDVAWEWGNAHEDGDWARSVPSIPVESSLYGSFSSSRKSVTDDRPEYRRGSSASTIKSISGVDSRDSYLRIDEGYASLSGTSIGSSPSVLSFSKHIETLV